VVVHVVVTEHGAGEARGYWRAICTDVAKDARRLVHQRRAGSVEAVGIHGGWSMYRRGGDVGFNCAAAHGERGCFVRDGGLVGGVKARASETQPSLPVPGAAGGCRRVADYRTESLWLSPFGLLLGGCSWRAYIRLEACVGAGSRTELGATILGALQLERPLSSEIL
jgi:hypothetical protein